MSILSLKPKSATRELSKREQQRAQQEQINAKRLHMVSREGLTTRLRAVRDDILALDFVVKSPDDALARENVAAMFARLLDLVQQVDVTSANSEMRTQVRDSAYLELDHLLGNYIKPALLTDSFAEAVNKTLSKRLKDLYRHLNNAPKAQGDNEAVPVEPDIDPAKPVTFPVIFHDDKTILAAARHLAETWERAASRNLTVSDRFTVDAIATSYLPDSLRLLANLSKYSAESKTESEQIFLGQLQLMQRQLDEIFKHEERNEISAMRAHTLFLESKLA